MEEKLLDFFQCWRIINWECWWIAFSNWKCCNKKWSKLQKKNLIPFTQNVITSVNALGTVITGQNPASTKLLASTVLSRLRHVHTGLSQKSSATLIVKELHPHLWIFERPFTFKLFEIGLNTIVIDWFNGELLIYNPSSLRDPVVNAEIYARGVVRYVMSGSIHHHAFFSEWLLKHPKVKFIPSLGLEKKRPDIPWVSLEERNTIFESFKIFTVYWYLWMSRNVRDCNLPCSI